MLPKPCSHVQSLSSARSVDFRNLLSHQHSHAHARHISIDSTAYVQGLQVSFGAVCRYSFGTGAQVLPIPELTPFRLTRQMRGALQPHDACAVLRTPCALGMAALRAGAGGLEVNCITSSCANVRLCK